MELTLKGIENRKAFEDAGIILPGYDVNAVNARTKAAPQWVHFGIGNIFRVFIGGLADTLLEKGVSDRGITCVEAFDYETVDKIYDPFDNLSLSVILHNDGTVTRKVIGSLSEAVKAGSAYREDWARLREIFSADSLQFASFTITEKGYALKNTSGEYFSYVKADIDNGPDAPGSVIPMIVSLLHARFLAGGRPIALVSMDNISTNGKLFREAVLAFADEWLKKGFITADFTAWLSDEDKVAFPWTMIDKITPRPSEKVAGDLKALGLENMDPVITEKRTYIAPFVNAEGPQYLVIEDHFPNGRPALEEAGVYMTDRDTVNKSERMKVTVCLNPIHSALGPCGVVLGYDLFSDEMKDPEMLELAHRVGYVEGMDVVPDPGILSPKAFIDECVNVRFPNPYLGDTCLRLSTDVSQGLGVRFGVTVRSYMEKYGSAERLEAIPIAIANWLRYLEAVDDNGNAFELAPDPTAEEIIAAVQSVPFGHPEAYAGQLKAVLSNESIFFVNLYEAGIGEKIEKIFLRMIEGPGAVRKTLKELLA